MTRCRSCQAEVLWLRNRRTNKRAPIDADPAPDGTVLPDPLTGTYRVLSADERDLARAGGAELHTNHACAQSADRVAGAAANARMP